MNDLFAWFVIKFDKLASTYESNMENAVLVLYLIIIGSARQQHDVWIGPYIMETTYIFPVRISENFGDLSFRRLH